MAATQENSSKNDLQNPSNADYRHPGESLAMVLVTPHLDGSNYHSWSRAMKCALLSKNKFKFVNGEILERSRNDNQYETWESCNVMVISWITQSLTAQIAQSTVYIDSAKELWKDLRERFAKSNHFRVSNLLQEINSIKQGERSITDYYTDSKTLWEELDSLRPLPAYMCKTKCGCRVMKTIANYKDSERVMCFLKGLGETYNTVKTQILLTEPLLGINRVFSLVLQQERHFNESMGIDTKDLMNSANQHRTNNKTNNNNHGWCNYRRGRGKNYGKQCSFCNKMNHTADECYSKHGYPPG